MKTTHAVATAALALTVLAGCGEQTSSDIAADPDGSPAATDSGTPTADPDETAIEHPTGADEIVLRIETGGGFVPVEYAVTNQPTLLLTGDGRLFLQPDADRQTRLIAMTVGQVDEGQVQELLALADDAGLLAAPPDYTDPDGPQIADAPTTTVEIAAAGGTWKHEVYALGIGGSPAHAALSGFVEAASVLVEDVPAEPFVPDELALYVQPTDLERDAGAWPAQAVDLSSIDGCGVVAAGDLVEPLSAASLVASFRQDGALYSVSAAEVLPGDEPCT